MSDKSAEYGPYHRLGTPGGPGCPVSTLRIMRKGADGSPSPAFLLDAGNATETELLRTIAAGLGIQWGHDDLGWWAVVPVEPGAKSE